MDPGVRHPLENGSDQTVAGVTALCLQGIEQRSSGHDKATLLGQHKNSGISKDGETLATGFCPTAAVVDQHQHGEARSCLLQGVADGAGCRGIRCRGIR